MREIPTKNFSFDEGAELQEIRRRSLDETGPAEN